ncbi:MAG TPA: hypothetical protein VFW98_08355 [Gemmatimonadaceae bacterium]|nr:hypothetical protein [Gemmatimonadaceae bacterium]
MPAAHLLFGMAERSAVATSPAIPLAGRTRLAVTLDLARVASPVTVAIEAGATTDDDAWDALVAFGPLAAPASARKVTTGDVPDFSVQPWHRFLRARITAIDGATTFAVRLDAPFIDATADALLFQKEARSFADGFARLVSQAEDDVLGALLVRVNQLGTPALLRPVDAMGVNVPINPYTPLIVGQLAPEVAELAAGTPGDPAIDARMELEGFSDAMRAAIVAQTEHLFRRRQLQMSTDPGAFVSLRDYPPLAPGLMDGLARYRNTSTSVWRGR